jgi:hypothetical protein
MKKIIIVFSLLKNKAPANFMKLVLNLFEFVNDIHNVPTRSSIVTFHGKTYVNDIALKRAKKRITNR